MKTAAFVLALILPGLTTESRADETPAMTEALSLQYLYMELCKDSPPLPPDRLRTIDTMTEMVDKDDLKKATIKWMFTLKLANDKAKTTAFCDRMAATIKTEVHEK